MSDEREILWTVDGMKRRFRELQDAAENRSDQATVLATMPFCHINGASEHGPWALQAHLSGPFLRSVKKHRKTVMPLLGKALLNLRFGYEPEVANSPGGRDGIFHVNRDYLPKNAMVRKLYDSFLDTDVGEAVLRQILGSAANAPQGVRVVSHGMRLLGFVTPDPAGERAFKLVLIDVDINTR